MYENQNYTSPIKSKRLKCQVGRSASSFLDDSVSLQHVIAFYDTKRFEVYAEVATVEDGTLGTFHPCSDEWLREFGTRISNKLKKTKKREHLFPDAFTLSEFPIRYVSGNADVIAFSDGPRKSVNIFFKNKEKRITKLPEILFVIKNRGLYAFEQVEKDRYLALNLPNISERGSVCMGNAIDRDAKLSVNEMVSAYDKAFWKSSFNSHSDATGYDWEKDDTFTYSRRKTNPFKLNIDAY